MKDSKGRRYDGWVLKSKRTLYPWTFMRTRRELRAEHNYPWVRDLEEAKVRLVEVGE